MASIPLHDIQKLVFTGQERLKAQLPSELCAPSDRLKIVGFPPMDAASPATLWTAPSLTSFYIWPFTSSAMCYWVS
jgi:hypothetical protein